MFQFEWKIKRRRYRQYSCSIALHHIDLLYLYSYYMVSIVMFHLNLYFHFTWFFLLLVDIFAAGVVISIHVLYVYENSEFSSIFIWKNSTSLSKVENKNPIESNIRNNRIEYGMGTKIATILRLYERESEKSILRSFSIILSF